MKLYVLTENTAELGYCIYFAKRDKLEKTEFLSVPT
jgi:hypothetical protein